CWKANATRAAVPLVSKSALPMRPAPAPSNSASNAPRGSDAMPAIDPARGPRPNRYRASAASAFASRAMRHRPLDRDPTPLPRRHHRPRPQVKFAAGPPSPSWAQGEKMERCGQHKQPDHDRDQAQWCSDLEISPEADLDAARLRPLRNDEIGDGADEGEIAGEGCRHGDDQPRALRILQVGHERLEQENRWHVAHDIR